jgi:hypothetical protein
MPFFDDSTQVDSSGSTDSMSLISKVTTGELVEPGTIAVMRDADDKVYFALEAGQPGSNIRPIYNPQPVINGLQSPVTLYATNQQPSIAGALLTNGNYVLVTESAEPPYNVSFWILSPHGQGVAPVIFAGQGGGSGRALVAVTALSGGGFALTWNSNGLPSFAIYSNVGSPIKTATSVGPAGSLNSLSICALRNGGFVIGYNPVFGVAAFWAYTATGNLIRAANISLIATPNTMPVNVSVAGLVGGGFVAAYAISNGTTNSNYFQRFDVNAIPVGPEVLLRAGAALTGASILVRSFVNGLFCIAESDGVRVSVWDQAGLQVGGYTQQQPGINAAIMGLNSHGDLGICAWVSHNGPGIPSSIRAQGIYTFGPGNGSVTVASNASPSSVHITPFCSSAPGGINGVLYKDNQAKACLCTFDGAYVVQGLTSYPQFDFSGGRGVIDLVYGQVRNEYPNLLFVTVNNGGFVHFGVVNSLVPACKPVGVFSAGAAALTGVDVQWQGVAKLSRQFKPFVLEASITRQGRCEWMFFGDTVVMEVPS